MAKGFDLGAMLKDVSNLDTGREQIEYISLGLIDKDPKNFYQLSDIKALADNIATCGLMDPLRVRPNPDREGRYMIVSGHRRHSAIMEIKNEQPGLFENVPCIVERTEVSDAMRQLRLIYANNDTRKMTNAEITEQASQVEQLLYELKEQGYEFPGRMRDHVADACHISKTKLARLKVIKEKLAHCWEAPYKAGELVESTAYALAQLPKSWQTLIHDYSSSIDYLYEHEVTAYAQAFRRIAELKCPDCMAPCSHTFEMMKNVIRQGGYAPDCRGCCVDCPSLRTCKYSCSAADSRKQALKVEARSQRIQEKHEQERKERPTIQYIQGVYERVGKIRREKRISAQQMFEAGHRYFPPDGEKQEDDLERGHCVISVHQNLPFGNCVSASDAQSLCAVADLLGCSIDYLLGREEKPVSDSDTWQEGCPMEAGKYIVLLRYSPSAPIAVEQVKWDGEKWDEGLILEDTEILKWSPIPKV